MISKLKQLSHKSQQIIKLASCIGSTFSFSVLQNLCQRLSGFGLVITAKDLEECISNNYIQFLKLSEDNKTSIYKFQHDR